MSGPTRGRSSGDSSGPVCACRTQRVDDRHGWSDGSRGAAAARGADFSRCRRGRRQGTVGHDHRAGARFGAGPGPRRPDIRSRPATLPHDRDASGNGRDGSNDFLPIRKVCRYTGGGRQLDGPRGLRPSPGSQTRRPDDRRGNEGPRQGRPRIGRSTPGSHGQARRPEASRDQAEGRPQRCHVGRARNGGVVHRRHGDQLYERPNFGGLRRDRHNRRRLLWQHHHRRYRRLLYRR